MSTQLARSNKEIALIGYDAWNARDFERGAAQFAEDGEIVNVPLGLTFRGKEGYFDFVRGWASAFPDGRVEIQRIIADDGGFAVEFLARGTHSGVLKSPAGDIPPTGKKLELSFCDTGTVKDGKITLIRTYFDTATMMRQLGLL